MYESVRIIDQKDWYILKIVKTSSNIHETVQIINLDKRQRDNLMLFLFADEELKSKQTLLNGTDSELFELGVRRSSTTSYHNDRVYDKTYTYC